MRWPAPTERPWALHGKRKRHFSEFSSEAARSDGGGIRAAATPTHGAQARPGGAAGEASTQGERQRRQRASTDSFCVFLFWGEGVETRCSCCRALYPVCWRGLAEPTPEERKPAAAEEGSTQREACNGGQQTARQAHRSKGPEKALRSAVCERCGDRWSRPMYRHRHTRANEQQRAALCGPVRRTRFGSAARWRLRCRTAFQGCFHQRRAHWGWWRGAVDYS